MTIHEQITALLSGDLTEGSEVGELLHVLAVSPEKRGLMMEQIRMSRAFNAMGQGIAPAHASDSRIWGGIAAIDAGMVAAPAAGSLVSGSLVSRIFTLPVLGSIAATLLAGLGFGYYLGTGSSGPSQSSSALAAAHDSLRSARAQLASLTGGQAPAVVHQRDTVIVYRDRLHTITRIAPTPNPAMGSGLAKSNLPVGDGVIHQVAPRSVASASDRFPSVATLLAEGRTPGEHQRVSDLESFSRQQENAGLGLKVGLRDNLRLSFPRVYGLVDRQSVLLDRELFAETDRLPIRVGMAAGETRFSQRFSTDTGGVHKNYEQSPLLAYGRLFGTGDLGTLHVGGLGDVKASFEVGGGGTEIGPFGTFGVDMEYQVVDRLSFRAGASTWVLASPLLGQWYLSSNFNLHYGVVVGF